MTSPSVPTGWTPEEMYGYALFAHPYRGIETRWHDGQVNGYHASLMLVPEHDFAVVAFVNSWEINAQELSAAAIDVFLEPTAERESYPADPTEWDGFVGKYLDPHGLGTVVLSVNGDNLIATFPSFAVTSVMEPYVWRTYLVDIHGAQLHITIWPDADGQGDMLVSRAGVARRVQE
jgi:hypothetical protein